MKGECEDERVESGKKKEKIGAKALAKRKEKKTQDSQFTLKGALLLKVLRGISPFSSSSGTFWRTT